MLGAFKEGMQDDCDRGRLQNVFTNAQLATMVLRHVIFHDVPNQRGEGGQQVVLATDSTPIDADRRRLLKSKLVKSLDSKSSYGVTFQPHPTSPVPKLVRDWTAHSYNATKFVEASQVMAQHLYQVQTGAVSAGLLAVIDITVDNRHMRQILRFANDQTPDRLREPAACT